MEREAATNWTEISAAESLAGLNMTNDKFICVLILFRYKYVIDLYQFVNFHISLFVLVFEISGEERSSD